MAGRKFQQQGFQNTPILGVGLGLRRPLITQTLQANHLLDWLEITPENYMGKGGLAHQELSQALELYPLVSHGVSLSMGSTDPWDPVYLKQLKTLFSWIQPPWFSDHLCFSGISGVYFNDLIPLPRTPETVNHVVSRIRFLQDTFQRPVLIENISFYLDYPDNSLSDAAFHRQILEKADCGLLLDVNNVFVNSQNQGFEPHRYLEELPLERVVQIHVAGHTAYPDGLIDTHGTPVCQTVWELLDWTLARCQPSGIMLERDLNIPPFEDLVPELQQLRTLWDKHFDPLSADRGKETEAVAP